MTSAGAPGVVLVGTLPPPFDGQSVAFRVLHEGLIEHGVSTAVVDVARPGGRFERTAWWRVWDYLSTLPGYARLLRESGRSTVYLTVAQSPSGFLRDLVFAALARLAGRRLVLHVHGGNYDGLHARLGPVRRRLLVRMLEASDAIVVLGERLRSMFDFAPQVADRLVVVPNGLPESPAADVPERRLPAPGAPVRLLYLSNLVESKGFLEVLEAVRILVRDRGRAIECDFAGEFRANPSDDRRVRSAPHARELFDAAVRAGELERQVRHPGVVTGAAKERLLREAHFFVLPTRYDAEGQPISIIEAMAYGCVVVSTRYRGIPELVDDGRTGVLLERPCPAAIADAVERLLDAPASWASMSAAARKECMQRFTREAHVRRMVALLAPGAPEPTEGRA